MPLEIRELIVKATVDTNGGSSTAATATAGNQDVQSQQEQIVNLCVEKVLEIIKEKSER